ncbi:MAG: hypothetical protein IT521_05805 [Burkholderiales bacterium]|nr:hypothetical protein [Burkholderiales bacterium]
MTIPTTAASSPLCVSCLFDAGAIDVVRADDPADVQVALRADSHADIRQWFRLAGGRERRGEG